MADINGIFLNSLFSLLLKKIVVPSDYHAKVGCVKTMLEDDVSGLVDSLTDFSVQTASVDFGVETDNPELTKILKKWLDNINSPYKGQIPRGIKPLAEEYFKERWKSSSFPILKITKWDTINGINVPTKMFFVDGESIHSKETKPGKKNKELIGYEYYLGEEKKDTLDKGVIITRPYGRWFDEYPDPFLIKRGIYHNWKIIQSLKKRESEILEQIIPYLLTIKKGDIALATQNIKTYSQKELVEIKNQFQELQDKMNSIVDGQTKSPIRVTQFDEEIKHLIPDLRTIFEPTLFASAEKAILSGLGFVDVVEAVSTSRRESILNPKAFIEETKKGVEDFKAILKELVTQIIENNKDSHKKYMNTTFYVTSSPVKGFMTDNFKELIRSMYDRGVISKQTTTELIGEVDFRTEVHRRDKETTEGLDESLYPPIIRNQEAKGIDLPSDLLGEPKTPEEETKEEVPEDKKGIEKENYDMSKVKLIGAPYKTIKELPVRVRKNLSIDLQSVFLRVFNHAHDTYGETRAFRIAWSVIKKIGRKNKKGIWVRKNKRVAGKLKAVTIERPMIEEILEKEESKVIDESMKLKKLEIANKQSQLLDRLLRKGKEEK